MTREQVQLLITGDASKAVREVDKTSGSMKTASTVASGLRTALAAIGLGFSLRMVYRQLDGMIDRMDDIGKGAQRIGASVAEFQRLQHAAQLSGVEAGNVEMAFRNVVNLATQGGQIGEEAFGRVGIKLRQLEGMRPDEIFRRVVAGIQEIEDPTEKMGAALQLFGTRSGSALMPMINGFDEAITRLDEMNGIISDESIAAAENYNDAILDLKKAMQGLAAESGVVQFLSDAAESIAMVVSMRGELREMAEKDPVWKKAIQKVEWTPGLLGIAATWADSATDRFVDRGAGDDWMDEAAAQAAAAKEANDKREKDKAERAAARAEAAAERNADRQAKDAVRAAAAAQDAYEKASAAAAKEMDKLLGREADQINAIARAEADRAQTAARNEVVDKIDREIDARQENLQLIRQEAAEAEKAAREMAAAADARWRAAALGIAPDGAAAPDRAEQRRQAREDAREQRAMAKAEEDLADARRKQNRGFRLDGREKELVAADNARIDAANARENAAQARIRERDEQAAIEAARVKREKALEKFATEDFAAAMAKEQAKLEEIRQAIVDLGSRGGGGSLSPDSLPGHPAPPVVTGPVPPVPETTRAAASGAADHLARIARNTGYTADHIRAALGMS